MKRKSLFIFTLFFLSTNCTPLSSLQGFHSPTQLLPPPSAPESPETKNIERTEKATITLFVTELNIDEETDLGPAFSELYLALFKEKNSNHFIPIEKLLYENSQTQISFPLDINTPDKTVSICLVSGKPDIHGSLYRNQKKKCKNFSISELLRINEKGHELSLQDKSSRTPRLELLIHTS